MPIQNAESYWYSLSLADRLYLERAVSAIVRYAHDRYVNPILYLHNLISDAQSLRAPIQQAVIWRLRQEVYS